MGCVYRIINKINNKMYIGYTTRTLEERWRQHIDCALDPKPDGSYENYFKRAIRKYGIENFKPEIIEESSDKDYLQKRERYWIKYYNTYAGWEKSNGYNLTLGGQGGNGQYKPVYCIDPITAKLLINSQVSQRLPPNIILLFLMLSIKRINHFYVAEKLSCSKIS